MQLPVVARRGQEIPQELDLEAVMSHYIGVENQAQVLSL